MSTLKNIQGKSIKSYATNAPNPKAGEMWYSQSELKLKGYAEGTNNTWSSGGNYPTVVGNIQSAGTKAAGLAFGGHTGTAVTDATESWNGSSWTEVSDLNTAREYIGGAGTQTATLGFGGNPPATAKTEDWNGSTWTEVGDLNSAIRMSAGAGTSTAALSAGGENEPTGAAVSQTEEWNSPSNVINTLTD